MTFLFIFLGVMAIVLGLIILTGSGGPSWAKFLCSFEIHRHDYILDMETEKGMGFFGGPVTTFTWECGRCGYVGYS